MKLKKQKIKYSAIFLLGWFALLVLLVDGILKFQTLVDYFGSYAVVEVALLILAIIGGSIGALLGMKIWHHKTMHKKFKYGLPLILIIQIILIGYLSK